MAKSAPIRPADERDVAGIAAVADKTQLFPPELLDGMIAGYLDRSKQDLWFVYEEGGRLIAFGFCEPERMTEGTWNLLAIGVLPDRQGTGVGTAMMAYLEDALASRGERILLVETMATPEFERTRRFYRDRGFVEEARIREFYEAGADKVIYWKQVPGPLSPKGAPRRR